MMNTGSRRLCTKPQESPSVPQQGPSVPQQGQYLYLILHLIMHFTWVLLYTAKSYVPFVTLYAIVDYVYKMLSTLRHVYVPRLDSPCSRDRESVYRVHGLPSHWDTVPLFSFDVSDCLSLL